MNKPDVIATLAARYIVQIGPDMTSGAMIALLSKLASEAYEAGEHAGYLEGVSRGSKVTAETMKKMFVEVLA